MLDLPNVYGILLRASGAYRIMHEEQESAVGRLAQMKLAAYLSQALLEAGRAGGYGVWQIDRGVDEAAEAIRREIGVPDL